MRRFARRSRSVACAVGVATIVSCKGGGEAMNEPIVRAIPIEETRRDVVAVASDAAAPAYVAPAEPVDPAYAGRVMAWSTAATNRIASLRHLAVSRPIARQVLSRGQMMQRLHQWVGERYAPGDLALEGEVDHHLGYLPATSDYESMLFWLYEEQGVALYDAVHHSIVLGAWEDSRRSQPMIAVTAVQALQDVSFGLDRFAHHERGRGDRESTVEALSEGDAALTALEDMFQQHGLTLRIVPESRFRDFFANISPDAMRLRSAPYAIREAEGIRLRAAFALAHRTWRAGGFTALDALMRQPPESTEQLFHADKLASREPPIAVAASAPASLATQYAVAYDDVQGELGLRLFLGGVLGDAQAASGATGWGGDRAVLLLPAAQRPASGPWPAASFSSGILVWTIVFDGPAQATRFDGMARRVLERRFPGARRTEMISGVSYATANNRAGAIAHSGRTVVVIDNAPSASLQTIANEALQNATSAAPLRARP